MKSIGILRTREVVDPALWIQLYRNYMDGEHPRKPVITIMQCIDLQRNDDRFCNDSLVIISSCRCDK